MQAGLSRLTSRFDVHEAGEDYAELAGAWLDPDTSGLWPQPHVRGAMADKRVLASY